MDTKCGFKKGKDNPNWKGGVNQDYYQRVAFEKLPNECELCKSKQNLEVHHKDKNRKNNALENLSIICKECHDKTHKKLVYWSRYSNYCLRCGSTEKKHNAKGYCVGCYGTVFRKEESKEYYQKNKEKAKRINHNNYLKNKDKILKKQKDRRDWDSKFVAYHRTKSKEWKNKQSQIVNQNDRLFKMPS